MNPIPEIKKIFWGFKTREVDGHLEKINNAQKEELAGLTNEIETFQREKDLLEQELATLADLNNSFAPLIQLELAKNRVDIVLEYFEQTANEDIKVIRKSAQQKLYALEETLNVIDKEIAEAKENIESELKKIIDITIKQDHANSIDYGGKGVSNNKNIGKVYPIEDWLKNNKPERPTNKENEFWGDQVESQPQESVEQMTADGITEVPLYKPEKSETKLVGNSKKQPDNQSESISVKSTLDGLENDSAAGVEMSDDASAKGEELSGALQDGKEENGADYFSEGQSDFWDSGFEEEEPVQSTEEVAATVELEPQTIESESRTVKPESQTVESDLPEEEAFSFFSEPEPVDFFQSEAEAPIESGSNYVGTVDQAEENAESKPSISQEVVRREIGTTRHKYVLGKIAGEDLLDDAGRVIIKKNDKITESVFDIAQKEGKLADLIIHMVLPGQEE